MHKIKYYIITIMDPMDYDTSLQISVKLSYVNTVL